MRTICWIGVCVAMVIGLSGGGCSMAHRTAKEKVAAEKSTGKLQWGDQGDGTYKNPILKADFSDPDLIRVGDDFYLIASDFHYVGMQVLHSKDLVNWTVAGQVFPRLVMGAKYDEMKGYGQGTWAPSIRYHDGEFYIFVCTPRDGLFMWHAKSPTGSWSDTVTVKAVDGWEDPCPFWDDDGQAYLVHSRKGAGPLILHRMAADGTRLLDEGREIYKGKGSEGPKMYKRHGYYYISLPEQGVSKGCQTVLRASKLYGPYERKVVLEAGSPHQGGFVELPNGQGWFIAFKSVGWLGRVCNLEPVVWGQDDWPMFGNAGKHVKGGKKPEVGEATKPSRPDVNDEFDGATLRPIWQWNHNPVNDFWSLKEAPGTLRLKAMPAKSIAMAHNTLTQKLWDDYGIIDVKLSLSQMGERQRAGITFLSGDEFGWVGVEQQNGERRIVGALAPRHPRSSPGLRWPSRILPPETFKGPKVLDVVYLRTIYEKKGVAGFLPARMERFIRRLAE